MLQFSKKIGVRLVVASLFFGLSQSSWARTKPKSCTPALAGFYTKVEMISFAKKLKQAIGQNKISQVASMVHYPLEVYNRGSKKIHGKGQFISEYSKLITQKMKLDLKKEKLFILPCDSNGAYLIGGAILFKRYRGKVGISRIHQY